MDKCHLIAFNLFIRRVNGRMVLTTVYKNITDIIESIAVVTVIWGGK